MEVRLAGHNVDRDLLEEIRSILATAAGLPDGLSVESDALREAAGRILKRDNWTPETISAAYARVSRDPRPVTELRADAREEVDRARRSNDTIVFGLGHASVAEHAVVNLDILGVSRLAVEEIERMRLCSYTEKSQRYILLDEDFVVPDEVIDAGLADDFRGLIRKQNAFYREAFERLLPWVLDQNPELAASKRNRRMLEGLAKEDARYGLSLATTVQLGETINARNLESLISRTAAHPLGELRNFSERCREEVASLIPSLIRYTEPTASRVRTPAELRDLAAASTVGEGPPGVVEEVRLLDLPEDAEECVVAAILHTYGRGDEPGCRRRAVEMGTGGRARVLRGALRHLGAHDPVLREFESVHLRYEMVLSASCFAQLKRHRMATLTAQDYDPSLGVTMPASYVPTGLAGSFEALREATESLHARLCAAVGRPAASYVLLNAHRRRAILGLNIRELYHLARLRLDSHAQWDIRRLGARAVELARERIPGLLLLACGKDRFEETRRRVFGEDAASSP